MSKSKKKLIIFGAIILILLIIAFILIFKKEKTNRVSNLYKQICYNQNFTFTMEEVSEDINYKVLMAQRGTDISINMYSEDEHTTTLVIDEGAYFIMHNIKEYYNYGEEEVDSDIVIKGLYEMSKKQYAIGKEEIQGKTYYYEEFKNDGEDFIIFANSSENNSITTRFYFDGDKIVYIKNIAHNGNEEQEELLKTDLVFNIDDKLFQIPEDYAEVED